MRPSAPPCPLRFSTSRHQIEQLKTQGNKQFASGDFAGAVAAFTEAIELAPENHVLYSNRSVRPRARTRGVPPMRMV